MAWTAPMTWVAGAAITAAQLNAHLRDNLLETAVAKATTATGAYFVGNGTNSIVQRTVSSTTTLLLETTTSTSFTDLDTVGPTATVTSGNRVLMVLKCVLSNNTVNALSAMGVSSSGAHTVSASDIYSLRHTSSTANAQVAASFVHIFGVTPGTSTWTAQYKVTSGTGNFDARMMSIVPF